MRPLVSVFATMALLRRVAGPRRYRARQLRPRGGSRRERARGQEPAVHATRSTRSSGCGTRWARCSRQRQLRVRRADQARRNRQGSERRRRLPAHALRRWLRRREGRRPVRACSSTRRWSTSPPMARAPRRAGRAIVFHGHGASARIEGGVYVNEYAREGGVWKIAQGQLLPAVRRPL